MVGHYPRNLRAWRKPLSVNVDASMEQVTRRMDAFGRFWTCINPI